MTEGVQIALIAAAGPTVLAAAAFVQSLRNGTKIQEVHLSLNSAFDKWRKEVEESRKGDVALGRQAERDEQREDEKDRGTETVVRTEETGAEP